MLTPFTPLKKVPKKSIAIISGLLLTACASPYGYDRDGYYDYSEGRYYNGSKYANGYGATDPGVTPYYDNNRYDDDRYEGIDGARYAHRTRGERFAEQVDGDCERIVRVERGDTLSQIAEYCDVPVAALIDANPSIYDPHNLSTGERLRIPPIKGNVYAGVPNVRSSYNNRELRASTALRYDGDTSVYRVRRGDTLSEISDRYNIPMRTIISLNPRINPRYLEVGQSIVLPEYARYKPEHRDEYVTIVAENSAGNYEPVVSITPRRGAIDRDIRVIAEGFPPRADVVLLAGHDDGTMSEVRRLMTDDRGRLDTQVRLDSNYRYPTARLAVRTSDDRYRSLAEEYTIVRASYSTDNPDRRLERGRSINSRYGHVGGDNQSRRQTPNDRSEVAVAGVLTDEGRKCPVLRDDAGLRYSLLGNLDGFDDGDRVLIRGASEVDQRICGDVRTVYVWEINQAPW